MFCTDHSLSDIIRHDIQAAGPLSFARFMELALYHPVHGYYQRHSKQIGCQGDFYTSVSVGSLFGQLLAFQFAEWLAQLTPGQTGAATPGKAVPRPLAGGPSANTGSKLQIVEAGAHNGQLALDILTWLQSHRPGLLASLSYWILEPSLTRQRAQQELLRPVAQHVQWFDSWNLISDGGVQGVIFSNELLDSFPLFRIGWDVPRQCWFEWRVGWAGEHFDWRRSAELSTEILDELRLPFWRELPPELLALLPDGFTTELCPSARDWWRQAAARLSHGKLLTIDYGLQAHEFLAPHRKHGTLRAYKAHRLADDPLAQPGEQDLTAHVNFTAIQEVGERCGLQTESLVSQAALLVRVADLAFQDLSHFGPWTDAQNRAFRTLTHPNHLGRAFSVLVQARQ